MYVYFSGMNEVIVFIWDPAVFVVIITKKKVWTGNYIFLEKLPTFCKSQVHCSSSSKEEYYNLSH